MIDIPQWQMILEMFKSHSGVLYTSDFARHPKLSCEYRRALCDLRKNGHDYTAEPVNKSLWRYRLSMFDQDGQAVLLPMSSEEAMALH